MKKLVSALLAVTLIMSPIGNIIFTDDVSTVEAKGYKSGKKGFNPTNNYNKPQVDKKKEDTSSLNKSTNTTNNTSKKGGFFSGGLMKGLFVGGIAGLLFGGLFANMGVLGSILGLMVNVLAIVFVIGIVRKIFAMIKEKKQQKEDRNPWQTR
ncbi:hypothetical protein [Sporosarcina koreensis]|uniref:Preprotein translocase subunit Tim44 n=1 Tax=Sporosarcina koreensis TaxID=334735 RepID=A0ABW0TW36_9BACL